MTTITLVQETTFKVRECPECGVSYCVTEGFIKERIRNHQDFYCPNGHARHFPGKNLEEILQEKLAAKEAELRQAEHDRDIERTRAAATKKKLEAVTTKAKRDAHRTACGVCTHCNRTFKQLAAHMKNKHPEVV